MNGKFKKILIAIGIASVALLGITQMARLGDVVEPKKLTLAELGLREASAEELKAPVLSGLTEHTAKMKIALGEKFDIDHYSLYRQGDPEDHGVGRAVDYMVYTDEAKGDEIAQYLTEHIRDLDVKYIIWKQKFYMPVRNIYGPANTWNDMPDSGSITANHYDHVHVSFNNCYEKGRKHGI